MKLFKYVLPVLAVGSLTAFTACSDDDNTTYVPAEQPGEVNPAQVFTEAMPTQVGGMKITTGADGKVSEITEGFGSGKTVISFDYTGSAGAVSKATAPSHDVPPYYDMTMTITEGGTVKDIFYIFLNSDGFAKYAYQVEADDSENWWFEYAGGHLVYMKRSEGGNEVTRINYDSAGNITAVRCTDDEGQNDVSNILYTDATTTSPIVNKGAIMLFDECFGIDMDEFAPAYYAGLLGKATANLPLSNVEDGETETFAWTINEQGLPASLVIRDNGQVSGSPIFFNWF